MSDDIPVKITIEVEFQGLCPRDPDKADAWSDEVGSDIAQVLNATPAGGTFAGSYKVVDWTSEVVEQEDESQDALHTAYEIHES